MPRLLLAPLAAALLTLGCGGGAEPPAAGGPEGPAATASPPAGPKVTIKVFQFQPDPIEVDAGATVEFENLDGTVHTVTGDGFDERLGEGDTTQLTFDTPGRVKYVCTIHSGPGMRGEVVVR